MNNIKVSVIIPCFNSSLTIEKSLNSIINQNFNNFEIIIVDNNSTDNTTNIAEKTLSKSNIPYKIIINKENKGPSFSRNIGINQAKGNHLIFIDSDDTVSPNHIPNLYNNINPQNQASFVKLVKVDKNSNPISNPNAYEELLKYKSVSNTNADSIFSINSKDLIKSELLMRIPLSFTQLIYNKEILNKNNLRFNESLFYGEDTDFALRYLAYINNVNIIYEDSYFYHHHDKSTTHNAHFERFDFVKVLENLALFYETLNHNDLKDLIITNRIPKSIFGNIMYLFYKDCPFKKVMNEIEKRNLINKLSNFKKYDALDKKFENKVKYFIKSPKTYYKFWKKFKNSI